MTKYFWKHTQKNTLLNKNVSWNIGNSGVIKTDVAAVVHLTLDQKVAGLIPHVLSMSKTLNPQVLPRHCSTCPSCVMA